MAFIQSVARPITLPQQCTIVITVFTFNFCAGVWLVNSAPIVEGRDSQFRGRQQITNKLLKNIYKNFHIRLLIRQQH